MLKIKRALPPLIILLLLILTRFLNLSWGLPFPFHPDERNIANSISQLSCNASPFTLEGLRNCLNPHFFAYGQLPIYLGRILDYLFQDATLSLRFISAVASVLTVFFIYRIFARVFFKDEKFNIWLLLLFVFSPGLIQSAHFGTTESLLILFFTWLVYESLLFINNKISLKHFILISGLVSGLAVATKISSLIFIALPIVAVLYSSSNIEKTGSQLTTFTRTIIAYILLTLLISIIFSPHNFLSFNEFIGSVRYESDVALGNVKVFYTRQFENTIPILFQFTKIFPYTLGLPVLLLFALGFFTLPKNRNNNFLRLSFLIYFLPTVALYAKWTRFMAPAFPLIILIAAITLAKTITKKRLFYLLLLISVIPGIAFLSVYSHQDVRITASDWIYKNIHKESYILSETANVVDLPLPINNIYPNYTYISFNFYDLDQSQSLRDELSLHLNNSDYIFVPSRRIVANHQKEDYPVLAEYYEKLFDGKFGFKKIAEFTSYPKISLFGKTLLEFPDEPAEETFTVFDHPVIRIYKKI